MSSSRTPFIPAQLDDADLTPNEFRVFCRVSRRGECIESLSSMASSLGMHPDTAREALKTLAEASMIDREERPGRTYLHRERPPNEWDLTALEDEDPYENNGGVQGSDPPENEGGDDFHPPENDVGDPSENNGYPPCENNGWASKGTPIEGTPIEGAYSTSEIKITDASSLLRGVVERWMRLPAARPLAEPLPEDHPARSERHLRYFLAAKWSLKHLEEAEDAIESFRIPSTLRRKISREEISVIEDWADTFRLLQEQDDYDWHEVKYAIHWLFTASDWLREGYIASVAALRKKTSSGDRTKFDVILTQAKADSSYDGPNAGGTIGDNGRSEESREERFRRNRNAARRAVGAAA